tara:strand:- start:666 stop:869 length:204 start_codon:yes stop_codon:yes gene_type:complete
MTGFFWYLLIPISFLAVVGVLSIGLYGMFKGGEFNKKYSNKMMRMRITLQFVALVILMTTLWISTGE